MTQITKYPGSLHNHSEYSNIRLRDSINKLEDLFQYAIELGHTTLALTDHDCLSGHLKAEKFYKKIKQEHPEFKLIRGNEIYLCRDNLNADNFIPGEDRYYHFILLAKDAEGHKQIRELSTRAWKRSYVSRNMRRVPTYYQDLIDIIYSNPGHVIASTACLGGFLPSQILVQKNVDNWIDSMIRLFGKDNFYLELQPGNTQEQIIVNKELYHLAKEKNIPFIITTDTHYLSKEDRGIHKAYLNAQDGDREVDDFYASTYLMDTEELESFFPYFDIEVLHEAYQNIENIKNKCEDYSLLKPLRIPELKWRLPKNPEYIKTKVGYWIEKIPELNNFYYSNFHGDKRLAELIIEKLENNISLQTKDTYLAIQDNLEKTRISSEVNKAHWSSYFLNLQTTIQECWNAGTLVGPGRGSGVGFILLYILDIIQINPLWEKTKTFSYRFLNPDRVSVLD